MASLSLSPSPALLPRRPSDPPAGPRLGGHVALCGTPGGRCQVASSCTAGRPGGHGGVRRKNTWKYGDGGLFLPFQNNIFAAPLSPPIGPASSSPLCSTCINSLRRPKSHWSSCSAPSSPINTILHGSPVLRISQPHRNVNKTRRAVRQSFALRAARDPLEPHASSPNGAVSLGEGLETRERSLKGPLLGSVETALEEELIDEIEDLEEFLKTSLPSHPKLHRGMLDNGLRYVILPNKVPPNRFEAHLEMHVGSVDEGENEQGVAHMIEHVTFLGSKKREKLLGTGARSNAYTDFHHTVFHVHAPVTAQVTPSWAFPE